MPLEGKVNENVRVEEYLREKKRERKEHDFFVSYRHFSPFPTLLNLKKVINK